MFETNNRRVRRSRSHPRARKRTIIIIIIKTSPGVRVRIHSRPYCRAGHLKFMELSRVRVIRIMREE